MTALDRYRSANRKDRQGSINTRGGKAAAKKPSSNWKWASGKNAAPPKKQEDSNA
jgi:hypothetical protein